MGFFTSSMKLDRRLEEDGWRRKKTKLTSDLGTSEDTRNREA
ncbi:uncharacterized protein G2W53_029183 [Senna tora]|uniref:Uncharacterized protein n=1 Tax=Senna tora TaxID=362788 RepID=A0A834T3R0_9FABA|nr:uncharacterized protein G2W53_029183 [Senna tora]